MPQAHIPTALGSCGLAWNDRGLTGFELPANGATPPGTAPAPLPHAADPAWPEWVRDTVDRVRQHLSGRLQDFSGVPLDWSGVSAFQQAVYRETRTIRAGGVRGYGELARALGLGPAAARAVGAALGANPWPLIVPCHRVVSARGRMTGFTAPGGIRTKTRLLALEGALLLSE